MPRPRQRDPEATREAILDAARALFCDQGFAATSMRHVAEAAGVTKSLIHHHFGGKSELWDATLECMFVEVDQQLRDALSSGVPLDKDFLESMQRLMFANCLARPDLVRMLAWTYLERTGEVKVHAPSLVMGAETIAAGQVLGKIRPDVDHRNVLFAFMALIEFWHLAKRHKGVLMGLDLNQPGVDEAYLDDIVKIFVKGATL